MECELAGGASLFNDRPLLSQHKNMKKTLRLSISFAILSLAFAGFARAEDKPAKPAGKAGACCEKATTAGTTCTHGCCTAAAKEGMNCEKCGGTNEKKV